MNRNETERQMEARHRAEWSELREGKVANYWKFGHDAGCTCRFCSMGWYVDPKELAKEENR